MGVVCVRVCVYMYVRVNMRVCVCVRPLAHLPSVLTALCSSTEAQPSV